MRTADCLALLVGVPLLLMALGQCWRLRHTACAVVNLQWVMYSLVVWMLIGLTLVVGLSAVHLASGDVVTPEWFKAMVRMCTILPVANFVWLVRKIQY